MNTTFKVSTDLDGEIRAIMQRSFHKSPKKCISTASKHVSREQSVFGTKSYRDGLQRAFNKAKEQIYFNPDMKYFVTLTYSGNQRDFDEVLQDVKIWFKHERRHTGDDIKYIWIAEYQERGAIHIHMITNAKFGMRVNKHGYNEISYWHDNHGFTNVIHISDLDDNFRPYLYLFKYMRKGVRIGKSFVHTSRNLNKAYRQIDNPDIDLMQWRTVTQERTEAVIHTTSFVYYKNYLCYDYDNKLMSERNQQWLNAILQFSQASQKKAKSTKP